MSIPHLTLKQFCYEINYRKDRLNGGGITKSIQNNQPHATTTIPNFKRVMPYRRGDKGAYFEPKNKPLSGLNNLQKSQKQRKNGIVDCIFF